MREDDPYGYDDNKDPQQPQQPDLYGQAKKRIADAYKTYLGRDGSDAEWGSHLGNGKYTTDQSVNYAINNIRNSGEAQQWLAKQQQPAQAPTAPAAPQKPGMAAAPTSAYLKSLLDSGMSTQDAVAQFNKETGRTTGNEAVYYGNNNTIGLPDSYLAGGSGGWNVVQRMAEGPSTGAAASSAAAADPMTQELLSRITKMQTDADTQKAADRTKGDALYKTLDDRAHQSLAIDRNDPIIRAQSDAYAANTDRATRNALADLAEKSGPLANLQGQSRIMAEHAGQAKGGFEAELMGRELTSRRAEIADALNSMRGMLTGDQQMNLQRELASIDSAIKEHQITQQGSQFGQDLGFRYANLAQQGSQFDRNLAQQGSQFDRNLGFNYENMDQSLLRLLLGGLAG